MENKDLTPKRLALRNSGALAPRRGRGAGEQGYILIAVMFLVAMVLIMLAMAAPKMAADIQRDREVEMIHRGKQYVRAIKLYYKKFGAYPPNLEALEKSNEIRFLRKRYVDPMTGKDEWHLIHFGENKTPSYGFFGQPIGGTGGSTVAGTGPGGVGQSIGSPASGSAFGGGSTGGGMFGSSSIGGSSTIGAPTGTAATDPNAGNTAGGVGGAAAGTGTGTGTDPNAAPGSAGSGSPGAPDSAIGGSTNGQTFGGGGIIGVESTSPKLAILEWKKKKHFNEWEFWYDPNADRMMMSSSVGAIGQPAGGAPGSNGSPGGGSFGSGSGSGSFGGSGSSFGSGGGSGGPGTSSPAPAPPTTQPQQ